MTDTCMSIPDVVEMVEFRTGIQTSRQTIYNWIKWGWLRTTGFKPVRTKKIWVAECLDQHRR